MEYVINQMIVFSPAERALFLINERESFMPLSNPATRLLSELVKNNREMLTRRHLMQRVWEDNGFVGSNNNLNGCISEIRKGFESLAVDPQIIITVPKLGFILEADISPGTHSIERKKAPKKILLCRLATRLSIGKDKVKKEKKTLGVAAIIISCCGLAFAWWLLKKPDNTFKKSHLDYLYKYKQCNVFALETNELHTRSETIAQAAAMLKSEGIDCSGIASDIFYSSISNPTLPFRVAFMAICSRTAQGKYGRCQTIKNTDDVTP
ncbi:winged helix-turn-helix domain-containing protein [Serratia sp. TSA_105.2]|uniref:winged helix-turn-helix domain-containing protein n=1 Tax=Serratia sp. TSA_105.2 TaxID=3415660 RepID=UPI004046EA00